MMMMMIQLTKRLMV